MLLRAKRIRTSAAASGSGRYIDMYRAGMLKGGLLGQVPQEQLGEALPGTAPPPGTNIPPGLGQFLPDPAAPSDGVAPPPVPPPG